MHQQQRQRRLLEYDELILQSITYFQTKLQRITESETSDSEEVVEQVNVTRRTEFN
jgi:hypothetical protein